MKAKTKKKKKSHFSLHLIADFESPTFVEDPKKLRKVLWEASKVANNTPLKSSIHKFPLQGITGVILLAESHIAIHTWPEHDYLAIDIFTCGRDTKPYAALDYLKEVFKPKKVKVMFIKRGNA